MTSPERTPQDDLRAVYQWALTNADLKVDSETTFRNFFITHGGENLSQPTMWRCLHERIGRATENKLRRGIDAIKQEFNPSLVYEEQSSDSHRRTTVQHETPLDEIYRGVWSLIQFRVVRQNAKQTLPPKHCRAAILIYGNDIKNSRRREIEIYGITSTWKGSAYQLENKIYITAREQRYGYEDAFIICMRAFEADRVPQHDGIVTGVGRSPHDSALIYSCRCLLKKSLELSTDVSQTRQKLISDRVFRHTYCRYIEIGKVRKPTRKIANSEAFVLAAMLDFKNGLKNAPKWMEGQKIFLQQ